MRFEPEIPVKVDIVPPKGYTGAVVNSCDMIIGRIKVCSLSARRIQGEWFHVFESYGNYSYGHVGAQEIVDALKKADALL